MGPKKSPSGRLDVLCSRRRVEILLICVLRIRIALVIIRSLITLEFDFAFFIGEEGMKGIQGSKGWRLRKV